MGKLNGQDKMKNTYTKEMLIKSIAEKCGKKLSNIRIDKEDKLRSGEEISIVRAIYNILEESIADILSSANSNTDVSIRLFEGITIDSTFIPEKTKLNNLTGKLITSASKIKPKANITRNYRNKLTSNNK
jgi:hypothetical protein